MLRIGRLVVIVMALGLFAVAPAGAQQATDARPDPNALGVLDRSDAREPLAVVAVAAGFALVALTLASVVEGRREVVASGSVPAIGRFPRTLWGWQAGAVEVGRPEGQALDPTG